MSQNYIFVFRNEKPFLIKVVSGLILLFAIIKLLNTPLYGVLLGLLSAGLFAYQTGIEINMSERKYRNITTFGPQFFGTWEDIPDLDYVSIFKTNIVNTATGLSGTTVSQKDAVIQVSLVTSHNAKIKIFEGKVPKEAIATAKLFAEGLKLNIWDATIRPADWYKDL